jgi:hypothetical protein
VKRFSFLYVVLFAFVCIFSVPSMKADTWQRRTHVTLHQPIEIPGHVLLPGTYLMKLLNLDSERDIVQFLNRGETHVIATVLAVPDYEPNQVRDHTVFTFEERAANAPQALKAWFYPGNPWGVEFVYPKVKLVSNSASPTTLTPRPAEPVAAPRAEAKPQPAPAPVIAQNVAPSKPAEVAQAQPAPAPAEQKRELPKTASSLPLAALLGGLAVASGSLLKVFARSV